MAEPAAPVVVSFSGDLLGAYLVASHARVGARVVAVTVDTGLAPEQVEGLAGQARALGADEHVVADAAEHVYDRYLGWLIKGGVLVGGVYPPWATAERYAELDLLVAHARRRGIAALAHPAAAEERVVLEATLRAQAPDLRLVEVEVGPLQARAWLEDQGLLAALGSAARLDLGGPVVRVGAWATTATGGDLEDPWSSPDDELFPTVPDATDAAALAEEFEVEFAQGLPVACCGAALDGPGLLRQVARIARRHGVGRGVHLGEGPLGLVTRVAFEAPAAAVVLLAHAELERLVLTARQRSVKDGLARTYGDLFLRGLLHEPLMRDIEQLFHSTQRVVTGAVRVRVHRGVARVVGVRSPAGLAGPEAWADASTAIDPRDAAGFARVVALPGRLARGRDERAARDARASDLPEDEEDDLHAS